MLIVKRNPGNSEEKKAIILVIWVLLFRRCNFLMRLDLKITFHSNTYCWYIWHNWRFYCILCYVLLYIWLCGLLNFYTYSRIQFLQKYMIMHNYNDVLSLNQHVAGSYGNTLPVIGADLRLISMLLFLIII